MGPETPTRTGRTASAGAIRLPGGAAWSSVGLPVHLPLPDADCVQLASGSQACSQHRPAQQRRAICSTGRRMRRVTHCHALHAGARPQRRPARPSGPSWSPPQLKTQTRQSTPRRPGSRPRQRGLRRGLPRQRQGRRMSRVCCRRRLRGLQLRRRLRRSRGPGPCRTAGARCP